MIIVDDPLVRAGLAMILGSADDREVVGESGSGHGLGALVDEVKS